MEKASEPPTPIEAPKPALPIAEPAIPQGATEEHAINNSQEGEAPAAINDEQAAESDQPVDGVCHPMF